MCCIGLWRRFSFVAACLFALAAPVQALNYSAVELDDGKCRPNCSAAIVATGSISAKEVEDLRWFMSETNRAKRFAKLLVIHSPGGNAYGGLSLGAFLRQNGVTVVVARSDGQPVTRTSGLGKGLCGSACVFVLAGGTRRIVPPGSVVAVHGARPVQTEVHDRIAGTVNRLEVDRGQIASSFARYYQTMGINPALAKLAESIPHSEFRVLSQAELAKFRLAQSKL